MQMDSKQLKTTNIDLVHEYNNLITRAINMGLFGKLNYRGHRYLYCDLMPGKGYYVESPERRYYLHKEETRQFLRQKLSSLNDYIEYVKEQEEINVTLGSLSKELKVLFDIDNARATAMTEAIMDLESKDFNPAALRILKAKLEREYDGYYC